MLFFLRSMFSFRSVLDRSMTVQEKKIHRVLYTWRLGLIEYYMCCLRCLGYVWCVRREGGAVVGRRRVVMVVYGVWWRVGLAPWCSEAGGPVKDNTW